MMFHTMCTALYTVEHDFGFSADTPILHKYIHKRSHKIVEHDTWLVHVASSSSLSLYSVSGSLCMLMAIPHYITHQAISSMFASHRSLITIHECNISKLSSSSNITLFAIFLHASADKCTLYSIHTSHTDNSFRCTFFHLPASCSLFSAFAHFFHSHSSSFVLQMHVDVLKISPTNFQSTGRERRERERERV